MSHRHVDILIAGAGYAGLATAIAVGTACPHLNILIVDAGSKYTGQSDQRASAIAAAAENMLDALGLWDTMLPDAQPIYKMIVTDSGLSDPVRPIFLNFDDKIEGDRPFAHMVPNKSMMLALKKKVEELQIPILANSAVKDLIYDNHQTIVAVLDKSKISAKLLIAADGVQSKIRHMAGIRTLTWQYGQSAIVTTIAHERPHNGLAQEHFLPGGPFAILPLKGNRSSLVWTESARHADKLVTSDDMVFELELKRRFGHKLGEIRLDGDRRVFPLSLTLVREFVQNRLALVGDAAHGIHPIAGQGLNLGYKDVAALAEVIVDAERLGLDIGAFDCLERYQIWRRFDTVQMGMITDILNRLFSNDISLLRHMRSFGLSLVERMPRLKKDFIEHAAGIQKQNDPKLLKGHAI